MGARPGWVNEPATLLVIVLLLLLVLLLVLVLDLRFA
jgi:hypothetical protein